MAWVLIEPVNGGQQQIRYERTFLTWGTSHKGKPLPEGQRSNGQAAFRVVERADEKKALKPTKAGPGPVAELPVPALPNELAKDVDVAPVPALPEEAASLSDQPDAGDGLGPDGTPVSDPPVAAKKKMGRPAKVKA